MTNNSEKIKPMNNRPMKVLLVGFGRMGQIHARLLQQLNGAVRLVGIVDPHADLATMSQDLAGIPFFLACKDWRESGNSADLMLIASPNGWHPIHLGYALDMNLPALVEKPLCTHTEHALPLAERAEGLHLPVWVMMQSRQNPALQHLHELVHGGELGEILRVDVQCYWNRGKDYYKRGGWQGHPQLDGGTLYTQFSHVVDAIHWIFGPWQQFSAQIDNLTHRDMHGLDDNGSIQFRTALGAMGTLNYSTSTYPCTLDQCMTVLGSRGTVRLVGQYMNQFFWYQVQGREQAPLLPMAGPDEHRLALWRQIIALHQANSLSASLELSGTIPYNGSTSLVGLREATEVVGLIEGIYAKAERGPYAMTHLDTPHEFTNSDVPSFQKAIPSI
jgi:predicted dehydrogenase